MASPFLRKTIGYCFVRNPVGASFLVVGTTKRLGASGAPMGKVPLPILKELEHQARQNISTLNYTAAFAKTSSSCNVTLEKCQHSLKSTFKKVKSQIQKGANPEKAAKRGYQEA